MASKSKFLTKQNPQEQPTPPASTDYVLDKEQFLLTFITTLQQLEYQLEIMLAQLHSHEN